MMSVTKKIAHRLTGLAHRYGWMPARLRDHGRLRILCYHGVCADDQIGKSWVPEYFVSASSFAEQMEMVSRSGQVVQLRDLYGDRPRRPLDCRPRFAVTFDDVAACSYVHALPILNAMGMTATFFVATNPTSSGRLFDADLLRLVQCYPQFVSDSLFERLSALIQTPDAFKRLEIWRYRSLMEGVESALRKHLDPTIIETLRPLNWDEVKETLSAGHEIAGHTADHVVLGAQPQGVRSRQIQQSIEMLEDKLHLRGLGFAYPNGGPGDFSEEDMVTLREAGVRYAVTTRSGFADDYDDLDLPRMCIGRGHTRESFLLELTGLLDSRRRRQQGWG